MNSGQAWTRQRERGSTFWVRFMIGVSLGLGWSAAHSLLVPITAYFFLTSHKARAASRGFLTRALDRRPSHTDVFRHLFSFSTAILDRVFFLSGRVERFALEVTGLEVLSATLAQGQGCILIGSHLGSFEALRVLSRQSPVPVRPLMFRRHTSRVSRLFEQLDPAMDQSVIEIGAPDAMLRVSESLRRGEIVSLLADRTPQTQKTVEVPFLGAPVSLPAGPFILAAALHAPTMLFFAVRTGKRRYHISFEPFAAEVVISRGRRDPELAAWVGRYAARLEAMARAHPFEWFNFYDFWERPADAGQSASEKNRAAPLHAASPAVGASSAAA